MERIFTIGNNPQLTRLGYPFIQLPSLREDEIHDWIVRELFDKDLDKLIIDLGTDPVKALKIAFHIRLSLHELSSKVLAPILFISIHSLNEVINESGIWSHLFATKGIYFTSYENAKTEVAEITGLKHDEYRTRFLDIINIQPDERIGRHSLANQWGAYVMDKAANMNSLATHVELRKAQNTLYFKYVAAHNFEYKYLNPVIRRPLGSITVDRPERIPASGKKILLIDDEADKGWETVLKAVFTTSQPDDFQVINRRLNDFDSLSPEEKELVANGNFDLFLIDLRLNGIEEEVLSDPNKFSGTKFLKKIKELNKGNQVIMFTASNKAWNMKTLLDEGADGYYIKESPEYNFPLKFSKENFNNFKEEVLSSLKLDFLRAICTTHAKCISFIESNRDEKTNRYNAFYDRSLASLDIAYELLKKSANNAKYLSLAYLTYFHILEDFAAQQENFNYESETGDAYVGNDILVIDGYNKEWKLKFIKKSSSTESFDYFIKEDEVNDNKWSALSQISFILAFQFDQTDEDLKKWGELNHIRNTKAGHGKQNGFVSIEEIFDLLKLVELFLTRP